MSDAEKSERPSWLQVATPETLYRTAMQEQLGVELNPDEAEQHRANLQAIQRELASRGLEPHMGDDSKLIEQ